jgi:hypothetical protein
MALGEDAAWTPISAIDECVPHAWAGATPRRRTRMARMARFGVRSGPVAFARRKGTAGNRRFDRTGANGRERSLAFAMQKVVGSSPIIRFKNPPQTAGFSLGDCLHVVQGAQVWNG